MSSPICVTSNQRNRAFYFMSLLFTQSISLTFTFTLPTMHIIKKSEKRMIYAKVKTHTLTNGSDVPL